MRFDDACPIFNRLVSTLKNLAGESVVVVQLGTSSGREIRWLAKSFPNFRFCGTDIFEDAVKFAQSQDELPNLDFETCSAKELGAKLEAYKERRIVVFSSGSMQYVQPEHLDLLFREIKASKKLLQLHLLEPGDETLETPNKILGSVPRGNFSYTHGYDYYAKQNGLTVKLSDIIRPYPGQAALGKTIHYDFYCINQSD